jgi:hypothetical protein
MIFCIKKYGLLINGIWDVLNLGCLDAWDVLRLGAFCSRDLLNLGHFEVRMF